MHKLQLLKELFGGFKGHYCRNQVRFKFFKGSNIKKDNEKMPLYNDIEFDLIPQKHEVWGPQYPENLTIKWPKIRDLDSLKVVRGKPICYVVDKDGFESALYSPATGKILKKLVKNGEIISNKLICLVEDNYVFFKEERQTIFLPTTAFSGIGIINIFKGTGFIVNEGVPIAEIIGSAGLQYVLSHPFPGVITSVYVEQGGAVVAGDPICTLSVFTKIAEGLILKRQKEYESIYGRKSDNLSYQYLAASKIEYVPKQVTQIEDPYSTIIVSVDMRESLQLACLAGIHHDLNPNTVLTCLYMMAASKVLQNHPAFVRPFFESKWTANKRIDIAISLVAERGEALPTIRGVNKMSLMTLYKTLNTLQKLHASRNLMDSWSDPYTFLICNTAEYATHYVHPGTRMSSLATLSCNAILPAFVYLSKEKTTLTTYPKMKMSLTYDQRVTKYNGEGVVVVSKIRNILEKPVLLL